MTMMTTSSQFGLEDMEALLWGPSSPTVDLRGPLVLHPDQQEPQNARGTSASEGGASPASPLSSLSSSSSFPSPPPFYSPPPSPPAQLLYGDKSEVESDMLSFSWLSHPDQPGRPLAGEDDDKDVFCSLDWMAERMDLSDMDLDSLIGSCGPDEATPSSPEDLLASLGCSVALDSLRPPSSPATPSLPAPPLPSLYAPPLSVTPLPAASPDVSFVPDVEPASPVDRRRAVPSPPPCVPDPQEELEIKSEPVSPCSPEVRPSPSPAYTLDLGSEVDVTECEVKPVVATVVSQVPRVVLTLSPTRIVLLLAPKDEVGVATVTTAPKGAQPPAPANPPSASTRGRPYPNPRSRPGAPAAGAIGAGSPRGAAGERASSKAPRDRKIKKMEQNKTAATRYRQKKRAEHDSLATEYAALERRNIELAEKAESMAREIQYLKELMDEVRLARIKKGLGADL